MTLGQLFKNIKDYFTNNKEDQEDEDLLKDTCVIC